MGEYIVEPGSRAGSVQIPSSKSAVHRLLICAALGSAPVRIIFSGLSDDIRATADCLAALGADIRLEENLITVSPIRRDGSIASDRTGGRAGKTEGEASEETSGKTAGTNTPVELPCGESGSTLRFLLPLAGALGRDTCLQMRGRLPDRPLTPFDRVLRAGGMMLRKDVDRLYTSGSLQAGAYRLPGNVSSQFFSGLLMALPHVTGESSLRCEGALESAGYLHITENVLRQAGIRFEKREAADGQGGIIWTIPGNQTCCLPETLQAEGDWSNAAFFLCMGALSGQGIRVQGLDPASEQGDRAILQYLRAFGAEVTVVQNALNGPDSASCGDRACERDTSGKVSVLVREAERRPLEIDAGPIPDLIPVLSVLACAARGDTRICHAGRLRMKESDRIRTTVMLIRGLGGEVTELEDGMVIHGRGFLEGGRADACGDHRIAMSAAVSASICRNPVTVSGAECVSKSYPHFWEHLEACKVQDGECIAAHETL